MESILTPIQARVLACMVEKEATTPQQYPLTVNALRQACNQKTARHPITNYSEGEVGHALRELEGRDMVAQAWSTRAARWEHHFARHYHLLSKDVAVLATLMLRGPQTAGEIRAHCARLFSFDDIDDVEYVLDRLRDRDDGALVTQLPRQPGQKEQRYAHLLCGEEAIPEPAVSPASPSRTAANPDLIERIEQLETTVADLMGRIERLDGD